MVYRFKSVIQRNIFRTSTYLKKYFQDFYVHECKYVHVLFFHCYRFYWAVILSENKVKLGPRTYLRSQGNYPHAKENP